MTKLRGQYGVQRQDKESTSEERKREKANEKASRLEIEESTQVEDSHCRKIRGILPESMGSYRNPIGFCRILSECCVWDSDSGSHCGKLWE